MIKLMEYSKTNKQIFFFLKKAKIYPDNQRLQKNYIIKV